MTALSDLARGLAALGLNATEIGRALAPNATKSTWFTTGKRLLSGEREPSLSRLAELSAALGVRLTIEAGRLRVERISMTDVSYHSEPNGRNSAQ